MSLQERLREEAVEAGWIAGCLYEEAAAELDRLQARVAELEANSERYLWLRDIGDESWAPMAKRIGSDGKEMIDAAIDTARKAKP